MILLGVGTGLPDIDRENTHMVWDGPGGPLLIDAGGSTYQRLLKAGLDPAGVDGGPMLRAVLLTHSHTDHINGLPALIFSMRLAGRTEPLTVYGLEPTLAIMQRVIEAFHQEQYAVPIEWVPINAGDSLELGEGWRLHTALTAHSRPCLASSFEHSETGRALVYSCDTEPCEAVAALAECATILIHEAATAEAFPGHTSPRQAGEVAAKAGVGRLVLVHYSPRWTLPEEQALAEVRAGGFGGVAEIGRELQVLEL
jgi:ribonuclease Z